MKENETTQTRRIRQVAAAIAAVVVLGLAAVGAAAAVDLELGTGSDLTVSPGETIEVEGEFDNENTTATVEFTAAENVTVTNTTGGNQTIQTGEQLFPSETLAVNASNYNDTASTYYPTVAVEAVGQNTPLADGEIIETDPVNVTVTVTQDGTTGTVSNVTAVATSSSPPAGGSGLFGGSGTNGTFLFGAVAVGLAYILYRRQDE